MFSLSWYANHTQKKIRRATGNIYTAAERSSQRGEEDFFDCRWRKKNRETTKIQQEIIFDADHALKKELSNRKKFIRSFSFAFSSQSTGFQRVDRRRFLSIFLSSISERTIAHRYSTQKRKRLNETRLELTWDGPQTRSGSLWKQLNLLLSSELLWVVWKHKPRLSKISQEEKSTWLVCLFARNLHVATLSSSVYFSFASRADIYVSIIEKDARIKVIFEREGKISVEWCVYSSLSELKEEATWLNQSHRLMSTSLKPSCHIVARCRQLRSHRRSSATLLFFFAFLCL